MKISVIVSYYNQPDVLKWFLDYVRNWSFFGMDHTEVIVVDDGSTVSPALPVILKMKKDCMIPAGLDLSLYNVTEDIPWNQSGSRNLGAAVAKYEWFLMLDIDHVFINFDLMSILLNTKQTRTNRWFTFDRKTESGGLLKPAKNIFLISRKDFFRIGQYDEDLTGEYIQDRLFIHTAQNKLGMPKIHPTATCFVNVGGGAKGLSRGSERNKQLIADKISGKLPMSRDHLRFEWRRCHEIAL